MCIKKYKLLISYFFVITFLLLKVVNLHAFTHAFEQEDNHYDCELCEFYTTNSEKYPVAFTSALPEIPIPLLFILEPFQVEYTAPFVKTNFSGSYFNKPPPTL